MEFKVVPFTAQIKQNDNSGTVATQMQSIIDSHVSEGWQYSHMDSVQTIVAGSNGCFGLGAQPPITTSFNVLIFKR